MCPLRQVLRAPSDGTQTMEQAMHAECVRYCQLSPIREEAGIRPGRNPTKPFSGRHTPLSVVSNPGVPTAAPRRRGGSLRRFRPKRNPISPFPRGQTSESAAPNPALPGGPVVRSGGRQASSSVSIPRSTKIRWRSVW
jgi:hypothetical protein